MKNSVELNKNSLGYFNWNDLSIIKFASEVNRYNGIYKTSYSLGVYMGKNNVMHVALFNNNEKQEELLKEWQEKLGDSEQLVSKKLGLPFRNYKMLSREKDAINFIKENFQGSESHEAPKYKFHMLTSTGQDYYSKNNWTMQAEMIRFSREYKDVSENNKLIDHIKELDITKPVNVMLNKYLPLVMFQELFRAMSEKDFENVSQHDFCFIYEDLICLMLHPGSREQQNLTKAEWKSLEEKALKFIATSEARFNPFLDDRAEQNLSYMFGVVGRFVNRYVHELSIPEIQEIIKPWLEFAKDKGYIENQWPQLSEYASLFNGYKKIDTIETKMNVLFEEDSDARFVEKIVFNKVKAWQFASDSLVNYYSGCLSVDEFVKIIEPVKKEYNFKSVECYNHKYGDNYTLVLTSDFPIDKELVKKDFLKSLEIMGEIYKDKSLVEGEMYPGINDKHMSRLMTKFQEAKITEVVSPKMKF